MTRVLRVVIPAPPRRRQMVEVNPQVLAALVNGVGERFLAALRRDGLADEVDNVIAAAALWRATRAVPRARATATPAALTVRQAADLLGVDPSTCRRWLHSDRLRGVQTGPRRRWDVDRASVERLLARH